MEVLVYGAGALGSLVGGCWRGPRGHARRARPAHATDPRGRAPDRRRDRGSRPPPCAHRRDTPVGRPRGGHDEGVRHGRGRAGARDRRVRRGLLASERVHGGAAGRGARPNRARGHRELRRPVHRARPGDLHRRRRGRRRGALSGATIPAKRVGERVRRRGGDRDDRRHGHAPAPVREARGQRGYQRSLGARAALERATLDGPGAGGPAPARRPARSRARLRGPTGSRSTRTRRSTPSSASPPTPLPTGRRCAKTSPPTAGPRSTRSTAQRSIAPIGSGCRCRRAGRSRR